MAVTRSSRQSTDSAKGSFPPQHLRQRRFPPRKSVAIPSTRPRKRQRQDHQSTLTQLEYLTSNFDKPACGSDFDCDDVFKPQRKKCKVLEMGRQEDDLRQSSLTQLCWLSAHHDSTNDGTTTSIEDQIHEEELRGNGEEEEEVVVVGKKQVYQLSDARTSSNQAGMSSEYAKNPTQQRGNFPNPDASMFSGSIRGHRTRRTTPIPVRPVLVIHTSEAYPGCGADAAVLKTPQNLTSGHSFRGGIPSSQSPDTTPLSHAPACLSNSYKVLLNEMPQNICAQPDSTPPLSRTCRFGSGVRGTGHEKENSDVERHELPVFEKAASAVSTPTRPGTAATSPGQFTPDESQWCQPADFPVLGRCSGHKSPKASWQDDARPRDARQPVRSNRLQPAAEPTSASYHQVSKESRFPAHPYSAFTPSQATTKDVIQPISKFRHARDSAIHLPVDSTTRSLSYRDYYAHVSLPPSPPSAFESQFPHSAFSTLSGDLLIKSEGSIIQR